MSAYKPYIHYIIIVSSLLFGVVSWADGTGSQLDTILSPLPEHPVTVKSDHTIEIQIELRLPLTPPPGVQQPAANHGWQVILKRDDFIGADGKSASIQYTVPLLRLRPIQGTVYRIVAEMPPWLPEGRFDVTIKGPGFHGHVKHGIIKGKQLFWIPKSTQFPITVPSNPNGRIPIVIPKEFAGIDVFIDEHAISPEIVLPGCLDNPSVRLAIFDVPPDCSGELIIKKTQSKPKCDISVSWRTPKVNETLEWQTLSIQSPHPPRHTFWTFGDGRYGEGNAVRHRFLLQNTASVKVTTYDEAGRICTAAQKIPLNPLNISSGCGCTAVGH